MGDALVLLNPKKKTANLESGLAHEVNNENENIPETFSDLKET